MKRASWLWSRNTWWNTCVPPENYRVDELRNRAQSATSLSKSRGPAWNLMGVRAIEHTRPALSRVPFLSSHFHQVPRHRDKLYDCSFLRVPPRSTDLWSTIVRYLLPFTSFFIIFLFFFFFFEIYAGAIQNREYFMLFFGRSCAGRWILLDDNAIQLFEILLYYIALLPFPEPILRLFGKNLWIFDLPVRYIVPRVF